MTKLKALFAAVAMLAVSGLLVPSASAHTAMIRASPDRDAVAGGTIAFIDLEFLDPVSDVAVTVTYNGVPVAGQTPVNAGELITYYLDQPLTQPGRYQVNYEMISFDSDFTTGGFFFTFDPEAEEAVRILEATGEGGLSTATTLALSGFGLVVLIGLLALFVSRVDSRRREQLLEATADFGHDEYDAEDYW